MHGCMDALAQQTYILFLNLTAKVTITFVCIATLVNIYRMTILTGHCSVMLHDKSWMPALT